MFCVLIRGREDTETWTNTEGRWSCEDGGQNRNDAAASQGGFKDSLKPSEARRGKNSSLESLEGI